MLKTAFTAALLLVCMIANAEARQRHSTGLHPQCNITMPCQPMMDSATVAEAQRVARGRYIANQFGIGGVAPKRHVRAKETRPFLTRKGVSRPMLSESYGAPSPSLGYSIARPMRYIAGRLVCSLNVNSALAELGIKGTGSALAHSFDGWGIRTSNPVPGRTVAVSDRRGGGHVALVSRVEGSRVWVWNATGGHHGWYEVEYTNRHARYRVAG